MSLLKMDINILFVNVIILWVLLIFNLLLTIAVARRLNKIFSSAPLEMLEIKSKAPEFTAHTLDGESVSLSTYSHKPFAPVFVSPTCQPCREQLPSLEALLPKARQKGIELVLVSIAEAESTRAFVNEFNISLPVLVAPFESNLFAKDYKVNSTPNCYIFNERGEVVFAGNPSDTLWKNLIEDWPTSTSVA